MPECCSWTTEGIYKYARRTSTCRLIQLARSSAGPAECQNQLTAACRECKLTVEARARAPRPSVTHRLGKIGDISETATHNWGPHGAHKQATGVVGRHATKSLVCHYQMAGCRRRKSTTLSHWGPGRQTDRPLRLTQPSVAQRAASSTWMDANGRASPTLASMKKERAACLLFPRKQR